MIDFKICDDIKELFPTIHVGLITGKVTNSENHKELWEEIEVISQQISDTQNTESIREIEPIHQAKDAYRALGKDPNRYRISAEALYRRLVKGQDLYRINTLVDALNLVSLSTAVTIGGFDLDVVQAPVKLGIGNENEEFEAIGRGQLNIHRLPIYRDSRGAIGSPTSDCVRTSLQLNTCNFLMVITGFYGSGRIAETLDLLEEKLVKFANGSNFEKSIVFN